MATKEVTGTGKLLSIEEYGTIANLASKMLNIPVDIRLPRRGSRMRIWKQDPTVATGYRDIYLHTRTRQGPEDSQIAIQGLPTVYPNIRGDFLFTPASLEAFDAVHTYAVVRQVLTMYQRALREKIQWQWQAAGDDTSIAVFPHAGEAANAFYSRATKTLKFFYFRPPGSASDADPVFTCRSLDIVAHEAGHAVLDFIRPDWWVWPMPAQIGGLHESFGDLTAIFLTLSQLDMVEYIIAETKANIHRPNILAELSEEFGEALGRPFGLRNADNDLKLSDVGSEVHQLSNVFTGAIYDILADAFLATRRPRWKDDAVVLYETGQKVLKLVVTALRKAPGLNTSYADVANLMIAEADAHAEDYPLFARYIKRQFERREVIGPNAVDGPQLIAGLDTDVTGCCGTMQNLVNDAIPVTAPSELREVG